MSRNSGSQHFQGKLYDRMSDDLHLAGMSLRTHEGYLRAVRQLADFCQQSPERITEDQLRRFFLHLKNDKHFASGSLRVAFSGVKFFYVSLRLIQQYLGHTSLQTTMVYLHLTDAATVNAREVIDTLFRRPRK